ncbi:uncharacterized protein [Ptychodera flava]|uniref:uncharacterized protein isoform X2 n=1 Tax=Ptychodera flava TaxID=63121 RepID=UPI003969D64F
MTKKWKVTITTKHCVYSVKDAQIYIRLIGQTESTTPIKLKSKYSWENDPLFRLWERDPVETYFTRNGSKTKKKMEEEGKQTFEIGVPDSLTIDKLEKLEIGHDLSRFVDGWLIGTVTVQDTRGAVVYFNGPKTFGYWQRGVMTINVESFLKGEEKDIPHSFVMGPVLGFRGTSEIGDYQLSALVVTEGAETTSLEPLEFQVFPTTATTAEVITHGFSSRLPRPIAVSDNYRLWRYDWDVPRDKHQDYACRYTLPDGRTFSCFIPAKFTRPRFALACCSGFELQEEIREAKDSNVMWVHMRNAHESKPIHLLVMGGNQVYADPVVIEMCRERKKKGLDDSQISGVYEEARSRYFELYVSRWRQPEMAFMLSRIPTVMMWDDHDIFDSWGTVKANPVLEEIYRASREMFILFQLKGFRRSSATDSYMTIGIRPNHITWLHPPTVELCDECYDSGPFSYILSVETVWFLFLDLRSERNLDQLLGDTSWREVTGMLDVIQNISHLFVIIGKPPIFGDYTAILSASKKSPLKDHKHLYDNYADHWSSPNHDFEQKKLFKLLLDYSRTKHVKVTVLSGNVNCGCWGELRSGKEDITVDMVTSSGIVNHAPPAVQLLFESFPERQSFFLPGHGEVTVRVDEIAEDQRNKKYIVANNFVLLTPRSTLAGTNEGTYEVTFVKRPNPVFDKNHELLKDPRIYTRIIR